MRALTVVLACASLLVSATACAQSARAQASSSRAARTNKVTPAWAAEITRVLPETVRNYEWFHANPELSQQEFETSKKLAAELRAIGLEVHEGIGGTGILAILRGKKRGSGPLVLYRADMDALPVTERTGVPYASKNPGVMHACGHDVHMSTALGTLRVLKAIEAQWSGTVLFIGQPSEETGNGAGVMLADPKFQQILASLGKPKVVLGLHDAADLPAGKVALVAGYTYANVDSVDIVIYGKGGHGAKPHETVDPVVMGAEIVMALQTIVSRRVPPGEKAVITVGAFQAGTKRNIIAPEATLLLTVRSYTDEVRTLLFQEIERVATQVAAAHNAPKPPTVTVLDEATPAVYNDPAWTARLESLFGSILGKDNVQRYTPAMIGEDFGMFGRQLGVPSVMWNLGAVNPATYERTQGKDLPGLHSDMFAPDPKSTLETGILTATAALLDALSAP